MALALTYTHAGSTNAITTMPGSPSSGDTISMSNGVQMLTWTYGNHAGSTWYPDAPYYSSDGTNYYLAAYCRDGMRFETPFSGYGDNGIGSGATLSIISATGSNITLQWQNTKSVTNATPTTTTMTKTVQVSMLSTLAGAFRVREWLASSVAIAVNANGKIDDWGFTCWSFGNSGNCIQMYNGTCGPDVLPNQSHRIGPIYYEGTASNSNYGNRSQAYSSNASWRAYGAGMAAYTAPGAQFFQPSGAPNPSAGNTIAPFPNGLIHTIACNPVVVQSLMNNMVDAVLSNARSGPGGTVSTGFGSNYPIPNGNIPSTQVEAELEFQYVFNGGMNWFKGIDGAYQSQHSDFNPTWFRPGTNFGHQTFSGTTMPAATSATATDGTTLYLEWIYGMMVPPLPATTVHGNKVAKWCLPYSINYWTDQAFSRPNVGGSDTYIGGTNAYWQTLATMGSNINPRLASTLTLDDNTYGYGNQAGGTQLNNVTNALAVQALARHVKYNLGNGTTDATTMIDKMAAILLNYQQTSGVQTGAFYKTRHNEYNPAQFGCMEGKHPASSSTNTSYGTTANTDEPHVSAYAMAEAVDALLDYYAVRGNQTLNSTTCAAALDAAMAWLLLAQQSEGGWLPCTSATNGIPAYVVYNNAPVSVGAFQSAAFNTMNRGFEASGSATIDLAASLVRWAQLAAVSGSGSASTAAQRQSWLNAAQRASQFVMSSENVSHGCYEYGEDFNTLSHYGLRMLCRGFSRLSRYLGNNTFMEHALYYYEQGLTMCKRVDEVLNNFTTGGHDYHTACLLSTINNAGVVAAEAAPDWAAFMMDVMPYHPSLQGYHWFYTWGALAHTTWAYRTAIGSQSTTIGNTTYTNMTTACTTLTPDWAGYAYMTPTTNFCGNAQGMDNTHFQYFMSGGALLLACVNEMAQSSSQYVLAICQEAGIVDSNPAGRTVTVTNPQGTSQTTTITIRGMAGKSLTQDGVPIATGSSGADMTVNLTLTAGQVTKLVVR